MLFCMYTFYHCGTRQNGAAALFFVVFCVHVFVGSWQEVPAAVSAGAGQTICEMNKENSEISGTV